ncbi:MAG TPA: hypothetical protein VLE22_09400 [Bryobacteraceae bacterium]|nr:hypothetical protein [Bryobacteraceae bacterium]
MSENKPNPVIRVLPSLTDVAFVMPVLFLFLRMQGADYLLGDGDTGWHIRTGDWILQNWSVPYRDMFSYTKPGQPWFAWEWLWDVVFAWLHQHLGMGAVLLGSLLVICLTSAMLFRLVRRMSGNVLLAIVTTFIATAASSIHWLARPHLFTLLFVVIFCMVLERAREGRTRILAILPFLTVIWTNLHGGFFVGIVLIGAYAAGELVSWLIETEADVKRGALRRAKPYVLAAAGCAAASLINPYTYKLHVHMWRFLTGGFHMEHISEYLSISFQHPQALWFELMIVAGAIAGMWSLYRKRFAHAILIFGWMHLALISSRNIPIFVLVAAPIVAWALNEFLGRLASAPVAGWLRSAADSVRSIAAEIDETDRVPRLHVASAFAITIIGLLVYAPNAPEKFRPEYSKKRYPAKALEALREQDPSLRNVFTHDEWGDYLIYCCYPETKVFIDGRVDFYGPELGKKMLEALNVKYDWEHTLDRYDVETVLLPVDSPLAGALKESRPWRVVYDDGMAIAFRLTEPGRLARHFRTLGQPKASAVACDGGIHRDRKTTKTDNRDPRITQPNSRSESL